jgi:hypothetical protein
LLEGAAGTTNQRNGFTGVPHPVPCKQTQLPAAEFGSRETRPLDPQAVCAPANLQYKTVSLRTTTRRHDQPAHWINGRPIPGPVHTNKTSAVEFGSRETRPLDPQAVCAPANLQYKTVSLRTTNYKSASLNTRYDRQPRRHLKTVAIQDRQHCAKYKPSRPCRRPQDHTRNTRPPSLMITHLIILHIPCCQS